MLAFNPAVLAVEPAAQATARPPAAVEDKDKANLNTVTIICSGTKSNYTQMGEDIVQVLDDPTNNELRVLAILGRGGQANVFDILNLQGVDMGMTDDNMLEVYKKLDPKKYANIAQRVQYIAKLANAEMHIIARNEIKDVRDLAGKKVSIYQKGSVTAVVGKDMFDILGIAIDPVYMHQEEANAALKNGEISAALRIVSAPLPFVQQFKKEDGLRLLPLDNSLPKVDELRKKYLPAQITHDHYPNIIPEGQDVSTIANASILATYAWPENTDRYRKVANFVNKFFDNIQKFMFEPRHPKWREINLAAEVPGWVRFKAAQQWLDNHKTRLNNVSSIRPAFEKFVQDFASKDQKVRLNPEQTEALVSEFMKWWEKQNVTGAR
jgi:TRAP transporter TAXI family solute receptor